MSGSDVDLQTGVALLLAQILKMPRPASGELRRLDVPQWDSLKHAEIVFALEDRYDVQFAEDEFAAMTSVSAIAALVRRHLEA
jgi:acyl carrier protein